MSNGSGVYVDKQVHDHVCNHVGYKCVSWTAIIVGAIVGIGLSFLLNLFSVAIGLSVFSISTEGLVTLAVGGFIGLLIGGIISMFLSGFTAGYIARPYCSTRNLGLLYGFATWSLALILTVLLTSHVGQYISSYSNFISNPATIIITTNESAPAVKASNSVQTIAVNAEKATNTFGIGAFIVFCLFFIGAISSCFGAACGISCREREDLP